MYWTLNRPTVDGFYFAKCRGQLTGNTCIKFVKVYGDAKTVFYDGENFNITDDCFLEWGDRPIAHPSDFPDRRPVPKTYA